MSKVEKEAFVTGHTGTTVSEILLVCVSAPIGVFLFHELRNYHETNHKKSLSFQMAVALESLTILLPITICQTILLHPLGVGLLALMLTVASIMHLCRTEAKKFSNDETYMVIAARACIDTSSDCAKDEEASGSAKFEFLTFYRSSVSYLTFVAILAVDFPIFPRSFAKTEIYGHGLMDVGAGSFCFSGGLVSWYARRKGDSKAENKRFKKVAIRCIPLLMVGFMRLLTTKGLEYQEHVSEYGVHWNFFFTLTMVGISSTFIRAVLNVKNPIGWIALLFSYQFMLSNGLQEYIEDAPRHCNEGYYNNILGPACHVFAANREGILGCIGYLIFHLASEDIAYYCLWRSQHRNQGARLAMATAISWSVHFIFASLFGIQVSRRSTNASFVAWTIAHNMTILSLSWLAFKLGNSIKIPLAAGTGKKDAGEEVNPPIFAAVNRHGLPIFLLANLMTGAVNLSIDTMHASNLTAIVVIFLYLCAVGAVALLLDWKPRSDKKAKIS